MDIFGDDLSQLSRLSKEVMAKLRGIPGLENVDVGWEEAMPEIQWKVDRDKAQQLGISFADVANTIGTATNGTISSYYQEKGFQYPIIVQMPESQRKTVPEMGNLVVRAGSAADGYGDVLLSQVAHPIYGYGPSEIDRMDRQRYVAVAACRRAGRPARYRPTSRRRWTTVKLPAGFYWDWGINQKRRAEEFGGMGVAVLLAIALIYMLLASQFESFVHPLTILFSVPLAATGVILGLFLTGRTFGLTAFIGVLMLVGIVVKNGILLVDYTNQLRGRGMMRDEALLTAGPTRLRPILMTASAAILGMLPLALALGKGSEVQAPMATAVIGGLATSTFLTLVRRAVRLHGARRPTPPLAAQGEVMSDKALREQSEAVVTLLTTLWRRVSTLDANDPAMEIPGAQMRVCGILRDGPRTMSAISDDIGISHSAITQIADRLERAGMVERVPEEDDRRCKKLMLTAHGREVMRARMERRVARTMEVLEPLSNQERAAAVTALEALIAAGHSRTEAIGGQPPITDN